MNEKYKAWAYLNFAYLVGKKTFSPDRTNMTQQDAEEDLQLTAYYLAYKVKK